MTRSCNSCRIIEDIRASGIVTLNGIAEALNARGVKSFRGGAWDQSDNGEAITGARGLVRWIAAGSRRLMAQKPEKQHDERNNRVL